MSTERIEGGLLDAATQQCPYRFYAQLRAQAPVYFDPDVNAYIVSSYALITRVLADSKTFSNLPQSEEAAQRANSPIVSKILKEEGYGRFKRTIVNNDPPSHTRYRKLVNTAFLPSRIRSMEAYIGTVVDQLIGRLDGGEVRDVVTEFAIPMPLYIISDQLGVPRQEFDRFKSWSDAWLASLGLLGDEDELVRAARLVVEMQHYMVARIQERRVEPRDDMLSDLVSASFEEEGSEPRSLTDREVLSIVEQILIAGNESTTNAIAGGLLLLARDVDLQSRLRASPELIPAFVEECLRVESPVQGLYRHVTADTTLGGVELEKGAVIMVRYASGNRDEAKFGNADAVDLDRSNRRAHIAFGSGVHYCVGQDLARAELRIAFAALLKRFQRMELAVPAAEIQYQRSVALRGPAALPMRFNQVTGPGR
ncbi:cytochrome P450 [Peristeroidobacter soli]|uniref:cytochrome P450 n=1 Tax=Peristeroidobacter soli TaxID=2497877 RepID=UPI00101B690D|nr:cytochrome P450 [Peristeroidobacter soli]